ncbi:GNAT family protein [Mycobacterium sp. 236(2023)]|nr:GNAT family protein [Mycobacterium sp. 236(2023)]MDG4668655.1 GNAT family protein [Mycobacterium sp. 236(2023)]
MVSRTAPVNIGVSPLTTIRALSEEHIPVVVAGSGSLAELAQFGPPYWRPRSTSELLRKVAATAGPQLSNEYSFVVEISGGSLVAECSLHAIDWRNGLAQVGVCVWSPDNRRQGYGRTAVQFITDWAFGYLGLARLEAWIVDGNEPSLELFKRLGFAHEATLRDRYLHAGVRRAMHVLALTSPVRP